MPPAVGDQRKSRGLRCQKMRKAYDLLPATGYWALHYWNVVFLHGKANRSSSFCHLFVQAKARFEKKRAIVVMELHGQAKRVRQAGPMAFLNLLTEFKDLMGDIVREYGMPSNAALSLFNTFIAELPPCLLLTKTCVQLHKTGGAEVESIRSQLIAQVVGPDALSAAVEAVFNVCKSTGERDMNAFPLALQN